MAVDNGNCTLLKIFLQTYWLSILLMSDKHTSEMKTKKILGYESFKIGTVTIIRYNMRLPDKVQPEKKPVVEEMQR